MRTSRPRVTEVESSTMATSTTVTTLPMPRARAPGRAPMREMSDVPMATTSPVETRLGRVAPSRVACAATRRNVRKLALSRPIVSQRWRRTLPAVVTRASPTMTPVQTSSRSVSFSDMASMARPMAKGVRPMLAIHRQPHNTPRNSVLDCLPISHRR